MILRPIKTPEMFKRVLDTATNDNHSLRAPNLVVLDNDGHIIGAVSQLPVSMIWMHTKEAKIRDAIRLKELLETQAALAGAHSLCLPCSEQSPYFSLLPKDGFVNYGSYHLFMKGVL